MGLAAQDLQRVEATGFPCGKGSRYKHDEHGWKHHAGVERNGNVSLRDGKANDALVEIQHAVDAPRPHQCSKAATHRSNDEGRHEVAGHERCSVDAQGAQDCNFLCLTLHQPLEAQHDGDGGDGCDHHRERDAGSLGSLKVLSHDFNGFVLPSVPDTAVQCCGVECIRDEVFHSINFVAFVRLGVRQVKRRRSFHVQEQGVAAAERGVGEAGHAAVRDVADNVLPRFGREERTLGSHEHVKRVITDAHDGEFCRCGACTDGNGIAQGQVKCLDHVSVDHDLIIGRGDPTFGVVVRHPYFVGVGIVGNAVPK